MSTSKDKDFTGVPSYAVNPPESQDKAMVGRLHEQGFNYALAEALRQVKARWRENREYVKCERSPATGEHKRKRPDILIDDKKMSIVILECAYGGDKDRDALTRLDDGLCATAVSVAIPSQFESMDEVAANQELQSGAGICYAMLQRENDGVQFRFPRSGYLTGSVRDLADFIQAASAPKSYVESVADEVAELIDEAASELHLGLPPYALSQVVTQMHQRTILSAFRTVVTLWLDAMLVHSHLYLNGVYDEPLNKKLLPSHLVRIWREILSMNWHSIFAPAVDVLEGISDRGRSPTFEAMKKLMDAVEIIESARLGEHISISGELFPKITDDRKEAAAFYTTPAASELLSAILIQESDGFDWQNPKLFDSLRIADLACGTGTLLRAAYRRVRVLHEANGGDTESAADLHKSAMEEGIIAADISPIAAHLTNSSMAIAGGKKPYGKTSIGWVSVGEPIEPHLTTGSLEYLKSHKISDLFANLSVVKSGEEIENHSIEAVDASLDYVIMNPPYSRTRGGQSAFDVAGLSDEQRKKCQARWGALIRGEPAIKTAGMAASLLCVARKKVKPGGKIGFVLPLTAAFADSWSVTRKMIVEEFEDILTVARAGGDDQEALSADTHISEMLLVATKGISKEYKARKGLRLSSPIDCVTLKRMPLRLGEAGAFGKCIVDALSTKRSDGHPVIAGEEEIGTIATFYPNGGEPWAHLGVSNSDLALAARSLVQDGVLLGIDGGKNLKLHMPITTVRRLFKVGPTHNSIGYLHQNIPCGAFAFYPITSPLESRYGTRSLWNANASTQNRLLVEPTHKGVPESSEDKVETLLENQGTLHYAKNLRWTSQALSAAVTETPVLGGRSWATLLHPDKRVCKAFALWANSTLGLISHWTQASRTQTGRGPVQVKAIGKLPCLDVSKLEDEVLSEVADIFDDVSRKLLKPTCQAHADPVRAQIDSAVITMLGLPQSRTETIIKGLRELWCAEPTVHGYNQKAVKLLADNGLI